VTLEALPSVLGRLFGLWKTQGFDQEGLGDFVTRIGPATLGTALEAPEA